MPTPTHRWPRSGAARKPSRDADQLRGNRIQSNRRPARRRRRRVTSDALSVRDDATHAFLFRYRSGAHFVDVFRAWYGPIHKALAALGEDGGPALERDLIELVDGLNVGGSDAMVVPSTYLEAVVTRR
jgi:hypothetical protein